MLARLQEHARWRFERRGHGNRWGIDRTNHSSRSFGVADLIVQSGTIPLESLVRIQPRRGGPEIALDPRAPPEPIAVAVTCAVTDADQRALQRPADRRASARRMGW
jgi:hypothetical protein